MTKVFSFLLLSGILLSVLLGINLHTSRQTGAPPYGEDESEIPELDPYAWLRDWSRPEGPAKVALQAGHWQASDAPDELQKLRDNTGSSGSGKWEWEVNLIIAELIKPLLESRGIKVEILPTTIPPKYWADVFVAIHADGSDDRSKSGYKIASSWRDYSGKADDFVEILANHYEAATGLTNDPNITRNMRGYYAFSWWRYDHSLHPMTTSAIVETGFLTNRSDANLLINSPEIPATAIADGIIDFLETQNLLTKTGE